MALRLHNIVPLEANFKNTFRSYNRAAQSRAVFVCTKMFGRSSFRHCSGEYHFFYQTTKEVCQEKGFQATKAVSRPCATISMKPLFRKGVSNFPKSFQSYSVVAMQNALFCMGASIMRGVLNRHFNTPRSG
ncbi:hypothetical protein [Hydrogenoanaerobacterium sp.]|uniref:hypothetical protein n=1 Tax=Hydrogenoanaerobacterium sp. TaxID=2953763 RepID=UPI0028A1EB55|nr:hypothetical protein [Hydrogenoanaerobacterium sp.]